MAGMCVFVQLVSGKTIPVDVGPDFTVANVQEAVRESTGGPVQLTLSGEGPLSEDMLLADVGVTAQCTLAEWTCPLEWHPASLGQDPERPECATKMRLTTEGLTLTAMSTEDAMMWAAVTSKFVPGIPYRSPKCELVDHRAIQYFGLTIDPPTNTLKYNSENMLLLVNCNSNERFISGTGASNPEEPNLNKDMHAFRLLIDADLRLSFEVNSGGPDQHVLYASPKCQDLFSNRVREVKGDLFFYVGSWCPAGHGWKVSL
eukprot:TRINITY_DN694_c0_g1_i1.p1 TRINITY_DN694_c0_g1~~TRINITY_DN694_c0_g1_i1.p1  ORF type:complete len:285 (+),score=41.72 TRINITY_DN694_c0_g1_i1:80-856(+)